MAGSGVGPARARAKEDPPSPAKKTPSRRRKSPAKPVDAADQKKRQNGGRRTGPRAKAQHGSQQLDEQQQQQLLQQQEEVDANARQAKIAAAAASGKKARKSPAEATKATKRPAREPSPMRLRHKKIRLDGESWLTKREGVFSPSNAGDAATAAATAAAAAAVLSATTARKSAPKAAARRKPKAAARNPNAVDLDDDATQQQESGAEQLGGSQEDDAAPQLEHKAAAASLSSTSSPKRGVLGNLMQEIKKSKTWRNYFWRLRDALRQIRFENTKLETYEREGWRSANLEKMRPEKELAAARRRIVVLKAKLHALLRELMEGEDARRETPLRQPDEDGIAFEHIVCSACHGGDSDNDLNDIVMCDLEGCNKAFHQNCCDPPVSQAELDEDADWCCRRCTCMLESLNEINDVLGTDFDDWREVFPAHVVSAELAKLDAVAAEKFDAQRSRRSGRRIRKPKAPAKAAWDTHSFNSEGSSSDESFDTNDEEELDGAESDDDDDEDVNAQESSLVLDFKRVRAKVDYRALAAQMFKGEIDEDEEAGDSATPRSKRKGKSAAKSLDDADYEEDKVYSSSPEASLRELYDEASD